MFFAIHPHRGAAAVTGIRTRAIERSSAAPSVPRYHGGYYMNFRPKHRHISSTRKSAVKLADLSKRSNNQHPDERNSAQGSRATLRRVSYRSSRGTGCTDNSRVLNRVSLVLCAFMT